MFRTSPVHHQERFVQAVFAHLVCGTTVRTTRHVQLLRSCGKNCVSSVYFITLYHERSSKVVQPCMQQVPSTEPCSVELLKAQFTSKWITAPRINFRVIPIILYVSPVADFQEMSAPNFPETLSVPHAVCVCVCVCVSSDLLTLDSSPSQHFKLSLRLSIR